MAALSLKQLAAGTQRIRFRRERIIANALFAHYKLLAPLLADAFLNGGQDAMDRVFESFRSALNTILLNNNAVTAGILGDFQMDLLEGKGLRFNHRTKQNERLIIEQLQSFLSDNAQRSSFLITETDRGNAAKIVARGVKRGSSPDNIARSLRRQFGTTLGRSRAAVIARTEVGISGSRGEFQGATNQKAKKKEWITTLDGNERVHHGDVDGEIIGMRANFTPLGERMKHPHDVTGGASAANLVNCRCSIRYIK